MDYSGNEDWRRSQQERYAASITHQEAKLDRKRQESDERHAAAEATSASRSQTRSMSR